MRDEWIQTATGGVFHPLDPRAEEVSIEDIAEALSKICRFGGHVRGQPYSVAQHSVLVSRQVSQKAALCGLLHDAAEAYIGDWPRPLKDGIKRVYGKEIANLELNILRVIFKRFDVAASQEIIDEVMAADILVFSTEVRDLMAPVHPGWDLSGLPTPLTEPIVPWTWRDARDAFVDVFSDLTTRGTDP